MGCLKLSYYETSSPLKVVYSNILVTKNNVQSWTRVDPFADKFPSMSPYCAMDDNPVNKVDPDGKATEDWFKNLKTGEVVENKNVSGNKGDQVSFAGSSEIWENIGKTAMDKNVQEAKLSSQDVLLATAGTIAEGGKYASDVILKSRAGFTSGKLFPNSPGIYSKQTANKINIGSRAIGIGLTAFSFANNEYQHYTNQISDRRWGVNRLNNIAGTAFPIIGIPAAVGDYYGQKYEKEITQDVTKPGGTLFEMTKFMLNVAGVPTGEEKK